MPKRTKLVFDGAQVRKLIDDSKAATARCLPYVGKAPHVPVGLFLVKDEGIYLLSNAERKDAPSKTGLVAYALGYNKDADYDKIRDAVGGDDFCDAIPVNRDIDRLIRDGADLILYFSENEITLQVKRASLKDGPEDLCLCGAAMRRGVCSVTGCVCSTGRLN